MKEPRFENIESQEQKERRERREQYLENTTLVIPQNDGESIMIGEIADFFDIETRRIEGDWYLPRKERDKQLEQLKDFKTHLVAVELEYEDLEKQWIDDLEDDGSFTWIDHHRYPNGKKRIREGEGCSLDQFLKFFGLNDPDLFKQAQEKGFPYSWRFIQGVAANDAGFLQGMIDEGYTKEEILEIRAFDRRGQYGENAEWIETINEKIYTEQAEQNRHNNVYFLDFGDIQTHYTAAKDKTLIDRLKKDKEDNLYIEATILCIARPSILKTGKIDLVVDYEGRLPSDTDNDISERRTKLFLHLQNEIQKDRRDTRAKPNDKIPHSLNWWKADIDKEAYEKVKEFLKTFNF